MKDPKVVENERKREQSTGLRDLKKQAQEELEAWFDEPGEAPSDLPNFKDLLPASPDQLEELTDIFNRSTKAAVESEMAELLAKACRKGK